MVKVPPSASSKTVSGHSKKTPRKTTTKTIQYIITLKKYSITENLIFMTKKEKIEQAIIDFVKGGDNSDTKLLDKVLHSEFRVTNNGFMGTSGVAIIDKQKYLSNISSGIFGGLPRKMKIENIDDCEKIANVKLRLESSENYFVSYNSLVLDVDNEWKLIDNLAVVEAK